MLTPLIYRDERAPTASPHQLFLGASQPIYCLHFPPPNEFPFIFSA